ncbi:hypothetical protein X975_04586, partial [Stegodyphus mimosarum]
MSSSSDERFSLSDKAASLPSPHLYEGSEKDEESRSMHLDEDPDEHVEGTMHEFSEKTADENSQSHPDDEYFKPIKKLRMVDLREEIAPSPPKPLTSFFIKDILNHKPSIPRRHSMSSDKGIVRPWDLGGPASLAAAAASARRRPRSADDDSRSDKSESDSSESPAGVSLNASPLDALFEMTSKAFEGLDADEKTS